MPQPQQYALDSLDHIRSFWGSPLSPALARTIAAASEATLDSFFDQWPARGFVEEDVRAAAILTRGEIRPILRSTWTLDVERRLAPLMLLYVPSIAVPAELLYPRFCLNEEFIDAQGGRRLLAEILTWLAQMQPMITDGSLVFVEGERPFRDLEWRGQAIDRLVETTARDWAGTDFETLSERDRHTQIVVMSQLLLSNVGDADARRGTALALDRAQRRAYELLLSGAHTTGGRATQLARIGAWSVPALRVDPADVSSVRTDDAFAGWRTTLGYALLEASEIPDSEGAANEVRSLVASELAASYDGVRREVERSNVLNGLRIGWRGLAIGGLLGVAEGLLQTGTPVTAAAVGGVTGAAGGLIEGFVTHAERRAEHRAVWDLVLAFQETTDA